MYFSALDVKLINLITKQDKIVCPKTTNVMPPLKPHPLKEAAFRPLVHSEE